MTIMRHKTDRMDKDADLREKVWKVIRGMITFSFEDIITTTELPENKVKGYLITLYRADYIMQAGKRVEPDGRKKIVWRLKRNTGPKPPVPCRCLYDPNEDDAAVIASSDDKTPGGKNVA